MAKTIDEIFEKEESKHLSQLKKEDIEWLNSRIKERAGSAGIECIIRGKNDNEDYFKLTPEEIIRQHYAHLLIETYGYSKDQIKFETPVIFAGKEKKMKKEQTLLFIIKTMMLKSI